MTQETKQIAIIQAVHGEGYNAEEFNKQKQLALAAPDLLEALEFLVNDIEWQENSPSLKMIMKAINKAKGIE